jgi:hypothetical protein
MTTAVNYNDILSSYSAYAPAIRPYLLYADTLSEIRGKLTKTTRLVFLDLVSRINISDAKKPIMVRVDRTAERLEISEKSVSRTIRLMRKNGWLEASQDHDGRNNNGEFAWREYIVTPALRTLLRMPQASSGNIDSTPPSPSSTSDGEADSNKTAANGDNGAPIEAKCGDIAPASQQPSRDFDRVHKALEILQRRLAQQTAQSQQVTASSTLSTAPIEEPADNSVQNNENTQTETNLSAGPIYAVNKVFSKKEASLQSEAIKKVASFEKAPKDQNPRTGKTVRIPTDLVEMKDLLDILPEGICALMALAKRTGQRLQDVWKAKKDVLLNSGAKNGRAVNYIRFLLNCGEDFSYIAKTKIEQQSPPKAAQPQTKPNNVVSAAAKPNDAGAAASAPRKDSGQIIGLNLITIANACRNKRFQHVRKGIRVRIFDGSAEVVAGAKIAILAGWEQMQHIYRDIALGELVEIRQ